MTEQSDSFNETLHDLLWSFTEPGQGEVHLADLESDILVAHRREVRRELQSILDVIRLRYERVRGNGKDLPGR